VPAQELDLLQTSLGYARAMAATAAALEVQLTGAIDVSDLLRAALVQAVSAFDHFVHEEVRARMLSLLAGPADRWPAGFARFRVTLQSVDHAKTRAGQTWLENEIRIQHGYLAFQQPDKVADALRLVSDVELWSAVGAHMGRPASDLKTQLKLIVDRRNKIAHEADIDPTPPRGRYPISRIMVDASIDFLDHLALAIVAVM
jgi:hypothetical protein